MESDLPQTKAKLKEALERVKVVHQAVMVDLPHIAKVSFLHSSLTPWSFVGCLSMLASRFAGSGGDVEPQVLFPPGRACSDGAGGRGVTVESSIASWSPPATSPKTGRWR